MEHQTLLDQYHVHYKKLTLLGQVASVLSRDQEVTLPPKGAEERGEQIGIISSLAHEMSLDKQFVRTIRELFALLTTTPEEFSPLERRSIYLAHKQLERDTKVTSDFVERFETLKSQAQSVWVEARKNNNFALFAPYLEQVIAMSKEYALTIEPTADPYDTLLDLYEEGASQHLYDTVFTPLQSDLRLLIQQLPTQQPASLNLPKEIYTAPRLLNLLKELATNVWFDMEAGAIAEVHHPFMTTLGIHDHRINTRFESPLDAITSLVHELGHGLYEQYVNTAQRYTPTDSGASMGIHESQSRTLENIIGRSKWFCTYLANLLNKHFPENSISAQDLHAELNRAVPSLIRVESDELTYNMHILLRYELEKQLMNGSLAVADLPAKRNELMQHYLGVTPPTDKEGCLQDVHRSCGLIGYFPTYLLGNIYAGQFFEQFSSAHPQRETEVAQGNFTSYFSRYKEHIRHHGAAFAPQTLVHNVCATNVDSTPFIAYLRRKYT